MDADLSPDLLEYLGGNRRFPYDPTSDQQFDQPQFESYRELGYVAARAMFDRSPQAAVQANPLQARFVDLYRSRPRDVRRRS